MATRSNIGMVNKDGTVSYVYCHFDGYLDGVGLRLALAFNTLKKVQKLISMGGISSLGTEIGRKHDFNKRDKVPDRYTTFYHRDRADDLIVDVVKNEAAFWKDIEESYHIPYLFRDGEWFSRTSRYNKKTPSKIFRVWECFEQSFLSFSYDDEGRVLAQFALADPDADEEDEIPEDMPPPGSMFREFMAFAEANKCWDDIKFIEPDKGPGIIMTMPELPMAKFLLQFEVHPYRK